ncbi:MAG: YggS family pyridoxal phosphate-dependent enzyme [Acidobacteriota bacterium]|nr:YggS family pyridoxal phosphate-dependent enzyme [Acidobacteriota bacterium]
MTDPGLKDRLTRVRERIHSAAARCGRDPAGILLLAVTKVFPAAAILDGYELGLRDFGENYVQEFAEKAPGLGGLEGTRYHLIGHLQSNKSAKAAELFEVIQTVDSAKLATRLNALGKPIEVMLEVKLSPEASKTGADAAEICALADAVRACSNLRLTGLMTVPPWSENAELSRPYFAQLRGLAERLKLPQLSMGMSNDLEVAIEEGSTCVRIGTALFGKRKKA